jgi:2-dehydro-3-deoxyphosphogluconate aldolase/(4S)-4-hydroxy-2-oxoglutarate aldolase
VAVGLGGPLFGDAASGGDLAPLRERARSFVALAAEYDRRAAAESQR